MALKSFDAHKRGTVCDGEMSQDKKKLIEIVRELFWDQAVYTWSECECNWEEDKQCHRCDTIWDTYGDFIPLLSALDIPAEDILLLPRF